MTAPLASSLGVATLFARLLFVSTTLLFAGIALKKIVAPSNQATVLAQSFVVEREAEAVPLVLLPLVVAPLLHVLLAP